MVLSCNYTAKNVGRTENLAHEKHCKLTNNNTKTLQTAIFIDILDLKNICIFSDDKTHVLKL